MLAARTNAAARSQLAVEHSMMLEGQPSKAWPRYYPPPSDSSSRAVSEDAGPFDAGQSPTDASEGADLIETVVSREQLNQLENDNIASASEWATSASVLARHDHLSDSFVRELHRRGFFRVWRWAGRYRTSERNPGWEVHRITAGVRAALDDARYGLEHGTYSPAEAAIHLPHRLVAVHPWTDGNGRDARLLADLVLALAESPDSPGGTANLQIPSLVRKSYLAALQRADWGDFTDLIRFCR